MIPYDGTPEIKERGDGKYLYVKKRVAGKQTSTYVGAYTEELYNLLLRNAREAREIRKSLRSIEKQLAAAGYSEDELSADVIKNIAFARANMKMNIYDQAVLEGVATSFPQTEEIIENRKVSGMTATDVQKILKLCLYCMKTQIFLDGNKRASVIFANHYLISHSGGFLVIPEKEVPEFKQLLVKYYEGEDISVIAAFMKERCWKTIESMTERYAYE